MAVYRCPVCKKSLTKKEYESALGILKERDVHHEHEMAEMAKKLKAADQREKAARQAGVAAERARAQRLMRGKDRQIASLQERIEQLKKGTTPQTDGLEFEETLTARLQREFREDKVIHKGKAGDILHVVCFGGKDAGIIIYECKRCPRIQGQHIEQARLAKQVREADFAVLVTTGSRKGFSGLAEVDGVLVVSPLGTISLVGLLRMHLIEMLQAKVEKRQRAAIAQNLLKFITGPTFRNPIEEIIKLSSELQQMIQDEAADHYRTWKRRWQNYQTIAWDSTQVQGNVKLVLHGKEPVHALRKERVPLQLPAAS
jgi:hypothetical protein